MGLIPGDTNHDLLVNMVSAMTLYVNLLFFPFQLTNNIKDKQNYFITLLNVSDEP